LKYKTYKWIGIFTFIVRHHRYSCRRSLARFPSSRFPQRHSTIDTIDKTRIEVQDPDALLGAVLETARSGSGAVDPVHRRTFLAIAADRWKSGLCKSVCSQLRDRGTIENVVDRIAFLSATRCDISTELEFIRSHLYNCLRPTH
jgi:hypothetical protein